MVEVVISIGDALDKLSILEIKVNKLLGDKQLHAKCEYDLLYLKLTVYLNKNNDLYQILYEINLIIWDEMELLRCDYNSMSEKEYFLLCKKTVDHNDIRFKIKNKINNYFNSLIKEQKSYEDTKILLCINDIKLYTKLINYLSCSYDIVYIFSKNSNINQIDGNIKYINYLNDIDFVNLIVYDMTNFELCNKIKTDVFIDINNIDFTNYITFTSSIM
jgi:hypothetical protein